jgi:conjugal transfer/entry exclusion protein
MVGPQLGRTIAHYAKTAGTVQSAVACYQILVAGVDRLRQSVRILAAGLETLDATIAAKNAPNLEKIRETAVRFNTRGGRVS